MAFQVAPNCAQAVIQATYQGNPVYNVLNFHFPSAYVQADIDALASAVDVYWSTDMLPHLHASYVYDGVAVKGLNSPTDLTAFANTGAGGGGDSGSPLPGNAAVVCTFRTGFTGRSSRGRAYVGGLGESILTAANTFSTTFGNFVVAAFTAIKTNAGLAGWEFVVLSRHSAGVLRPTATFLSITSISMRNHDIDSQRGRLNRGH